MLRLASMLYSIIGSTLAGSFVVIALVTGFTTALPLIVAGAIGFIAGLPVSWVVAQQITHLSR